MLCFMEFLDDFSLTQSQISTDNRKVRPILHSNMFVTVVALVLIWTVP